MEYIVYYNHPEFGYGFHAKSPGFPEGYQQKLWEVCSNVAEPKAAAGNTAAVRWSPLLDRYLLSVIFRQPEGDGIQTRGVNTVVNFLLNSQEADSVFSEPSERMLYAKEESARELLQRLNIRCCSRAQQSRQGGSKIGEAQLLNAASYAGAPALEKQAYFVLDTPVYPEVAAMLALLPLRLRKQVSFHTGVQHAKESIGIAVNFGSRQMLDDLFHGNFSGGQGDTNKYLYRFAEDGQCQSRQSDKEGIHESSRLLSVLKQLPCPELLCPLLVENVSSWDQLYALLALDTADPLGAALKLIPQQVVLQTIQGGGLSRDTLQKIAQSAHSNGMKEIRQAAKQALREADTVKTVPIPQTEQEVQVPSVGGENRRERKPKQERRPMSPGLRGFLWGAVKLVFTVGLLIGGILLLRSMVSVQAAPTALPVILVIQVETVNNILKLLGLIGISAAVSAMVTSHVIKWRSRRKKKENKQ